MIKHGLNILRDFIAVCDQSPGIYKMLGSDNSILYIGKAKNLKSRLSDYLAVSNLSEKTKTVISNLAKIEIIVTSSEVEAIFLESNLVKKYKPKYNILLKDDKSFPYIFIDETSDYPRIVKHRGQKNIKGAYWGPFASASKVTEIIAILQTAFLIRTCTDSFFNSRKRPCLLYQIKRCSAPCVSKVSKIDYQILVSQVKDYLNGRSVVLEKDLLHSMDQESKKFNYEKAAVYRDRVDALRSIRAKQVANLCSNDNFDVIAVDMMNGVSVLEVFFIRDGVNLGNKAYYWYESEFPNKEELLSAFLFSFYKNNPAPEEILVSEKIQEEDLLLDFLKDYNKKKIKLSVPIRGLKKQLILLALNNAKSKIEKTISGNKKHRFQLDEIQKLFNIKNRISRIEVYDNSHFSGDQALGVMVVCGPNGFNKSEYRKYNISNEVDKSDDYGMFREVLARRFKSLENIPDLIIIDGGLGQVSVAKQTCLELGLDVVTIGMAKGPKRNSGEEIIYNANGNVITLDKHSKVKQYLQVLRDEAHRFAISSNRKKMEKKTISTSKR